MGKKSIMQSLELASVVSQKDTHYCLTYCITYYFTLNLIYYAMNAVWYFLCFILVSKNCANHERINLKLFTNDHVFLDNLYNVNNGIIRFHFFEKWSLCFDNPRQDGEAFDNPPP